MGCQYYAAGSAFFNTDDLRTSVSFLVYVYVALYELVLCLYEIPAFFGARPILLSLRFQLVGSCSCISLVSSSLLRKCMFLFA